LLVVVFDPLVVSFDDADGAVLVSDPQPARPMPSATAAMATTPAVSDDLIRVSRRLKMSAIAYGRQTPGAAGIGADAGASC
jgi:hypothetical protein